jgi:hypothetical protein
VLLDNAEPAPLVVPRSVTLQVLDVNAAERTHVVFAQDVDPRQRLQLLEHCDLPVLRLRHSQAVAVASHLAASREVVKPVETRSR